MTSIERENLEMLERKAKVLRNVWLREREERQAIQLAKNTEVRKRWRESDAAAGNVIQREDRS
jgi:hypothetical protein